jgi:hypothetical protein
MFFDPSRWLLDLVWGVAAGLSLVALWWMVGRWFSAARRFEDLLSGLWARSTPQAIGLAPSRFAEELSSAARCRAPGASGSRVLCSPRPYRTRAWLWDLTAFALVAGLVFGGLVLLAGNPLPAMVAHVLVNAINPRRLARRGESPSPVG